MLRPSWARAQCELVKYTACRFDPETKAISCVAKKSVKCVTVCASYEHDNGVVSTQPSALEKDTCNKRLCEGEYGALACRQVAMQA